VDTNVERHHSERYARAYLEYLFSDAAQQLIAQAGYRPYKAEIAQQFSATLPPIKLFPITAITRDWDDANHTFFDENGILDALSKSADGVVALPAPATRDRG
jgi:sulfate/thiosulfate transport system substrate-binding protein